MRYWQIGLMILCVAAVGLVVGCESDSPSDESAEFDPEVDAPPSNLLVRPAPELLEDQALVAARDAKAAAAVTGSTGTGGAGTGTGGTGTGGTGTGGTGTGTGGGAAQGAGADEVKAVMGKMADASRGGDLSAMLPYFKAGDSDTIKGMADATNELTTATAALEQALKDSLGMEAMPDSVKQALAMGPGGGPLLTRLAVVDANSLTYGDDAGAVTVTAGGSKLKFVKGTDGWKVELSDKDKAVYAAVGELAKAQTRFVTTLTQGVKDNAVTEASLQEKADALKTEVVKPALDALVQAMGGAGGAP